MGYILVGKKSKTPLDPFRTRPQRQPGLVTITNIVGVLVVIVKPCARWWAWPVKKIYLLHFHGRVTYVFSRIFIAYAP